MSLDASLQEPEGAPRKFSDPDWTATRERRATVALDLQEVPKERLRLLAHYGHRFRRHQVSIADVVPRRLPDVPEQEGDERPSDSPNDRLGLV